MLEFTRTMAPNPAIFLFGVDLSPMAKVDFDASSGELLGTEIGPYTLVRRLGVGGMAETYVAIRRGPSGFSQRVCLKLVLPFYRDDEEFVKLFQREARLAAKLRHSNIVGVIDFGEIAGRSYMALELVDGVDLQVLLDAESGKRLSAEYVALIGHDLACALDHAHNPPRESDFDGTRGGAIVHRDISPSNVLVSRHGEIMLSDFGVAKAVSGSSNKHSAVKGKIPYMSPEQLRLESLDGRADLFGVGVVLFEALCGRRPYEGGHDPATIMQILKGEHEPLASLAPGAPPELCALIERLIEPDRNNRPQSAAELIELLDPFVPSPRVRRQLAKRIGELHPEAEPISGYPPAIGEQATAPHEDIGVDERKKRTSGIVGAGESQKRIEPWVEEGPSEPDVESAPERKRRSKTGWWFLVAVVLLAAGGAAWLMVPDGEVSLAVSEPNRAPPTEEEAPPEEPTVGAADAVEDDAAPSSDEGADAPTATAAGPGTEREEFNAQPDDSTAEAVAGERASDIPERAAAQPAPTRPARKKPRVALAPANLTIVVYPWGDIWINGKPRGRAPLKNLSLKPGRYRVSAGQGKPSVSQTIRLRSGEKRKLKLDVTK